MPHADPIARRAYNAEYHQRRMSDPAYKARILAANKARRAASRAYINARKIACTSCGTPHNLCFHHPLPSDKVHSVSMMSGWARKRIDAEITKCVVLCEACHRREDHRLQTA